MEPAWPKDRLEQLYQLDELLRECETIDQANRVLERLHKIIRLATELNKNDLRNGEPSFFGFLIKQAWNKGENKQC